MQKARPETQTASFCTLFQIAFGLPIAFSTNLEGSFIKMKQASLAPQENAVSSETS